MMREANDSVRPTGPHSQPPPTVLVVDDDPVQVDLLTRFLSLHGMVALAATSGRQCLQIGRLRPLDVIVLNVVMPDMDGLRVGAALKKMGATRSIPLILLTAKNDTGTRRAAMKLGVSDFVVKPVKGHELVARIQLQVEAYRKARGRNT